MKYRSGDQVVEAIQWDGTLESLNPLLTCGRWPTRACHVTAGGSLIVPRPTAQDEVAHDGDYVLYHGGQEFSVSPMHKFSTEFEAVTDG